MVRRRGALADASIRAPGALLDSSTRASLGMMLKWMRNKQGVTWISD